MAESIDQRIETLDPEALRAINDYIDELKDTAQDNYDFIVKYLKSQFEHALGTNDQDRAKFFAQVANRLEERIGRIPYDYEIMTGREKEDLANYLKEKSMEDTRQRELEKEFETQQALATEKEQEKIREAANERGMLDSGIQKHQQAEAQEERETNILTPQRSLFAYQQAMRDLRESQAKIQSQRNLQDITTEARRAAQDEQTAYQKGTEQANLSLAQRLAEIERAGASEKLSTLAALRQEEFYKAAAQEPSSSYNFTSSIGGQPVASSTMSGYTTYSNGGGAAKVPTKSNINLNATQINPLSKYNPYSSNYFLR